MFDFVPAVFSQLLLSACYRLVTMAGAGLENEFSGFSGSTVSRPKLTKTGKILLGVAGASFVGMCAVTVPFILPAARRVCLPYVPATDTQVHNVMSLLAHCKPGRLVDLGSGDGRIVAEAAKHGFQVIKQLQLDLPRTLYCLTYCTFILMAFCISVYFIRIFLKMLIIIIIIITRQFIKRHKAP